jgi:hypothetical protein
VHVCKWIIQNIIYDSLSATLTSQFGLLVHFSFSAQHEFIPLCFNFPTMEEVNDSYGYGPIVRSQSDGVNHESIK